MLDVAQDTGHIDLMEGTVGQKPRDLTPHASPAHFWGAELRAWRVERGLSLDDLGRRVHRDRSYLSKIERAERTPPRELADDCDRELDTGGTLMRLHELLVAADGQQFVKTPIGVEHVANFGVDVANHVDQLALGRRGQAPFEPGEDDITIPARDSNGRTIYVHVSRRLFLQGMGGAVVGTALPHGEGGSLAAAAGDDPWGFARTMTTSWPGARLTPGDAAYGADWSVMLPGGRSMLGSRLDVLVFPTQTAHSGTGRVAVSIPDQRRAHDLAHRPGRSLMVGAQPDSRDGSTRLYAVDARGIRQKISDSGTGNLAMPEAYVLDDLTYGILWATANFDDALQADDQELSGARADLSAYERLSASAVSREAAPGLNAIAHMWLGSDFCARHILRGLSDLPEVPAFWTREQRGEEASTWLLFDHKYPYLQNTTKVLGTASTRAFCIPEQAVRDSPRYERCLLFLSIALMESLGIHAQLTPDPAYDSVEGFVVAPNKQAIIANWVRGDGMWHVDTTSRTQFVREFTDVTADVGGHSLIAAPTAHGRLRALADYLGLDWAWLQGRCAALARHGAAGLVHPRSRLMSPAGLDAACAFVGSFPADS